MNLIISLADYEISWRNLNKILIFIVFLINIICYCIFPNTDLYNFSTLIINSLFCIVLFTSFVANSLALLVFGSVTSMVSYIFIFPRIITNLVLPGKIQMPWHQIIGVINFNKGYFYLVTSILVIFLGIYLASLLIKKFRKCELYPSKILKKNEVGHNIFLTTCIFFIIVIITNLVFKFTIFNFDDEPRNNKILGILSFLFSASLAANCGIFYLKTGFESIKYARFYIALIAILYLVLCVLLGSRSGPLTLIYILVGTELLLNKDFKLSIKKYLLYCTGFIIISILSFRIGTDFRNSIMRDNPVYAQAQKNESYQMAEETKKNNVNKDRKNNLNINFDVGTEKLLIRLFYPFDLSILSIVLDQDYEYQKKYMNMQYMIKSSINNVVPGTIFKDANLNTAIIWPFLFKIRDKDILNNVYYYETFAWGFWSIFYVMYGPYLGLFLIFILGIFWGLIFHKILVRKNKEVFASYFIFISFPFIFLAGIDDYISWSIQIFISLLTYFSVRRFINLFHKQ